MPWQCLHAWMQGNPLYRPGTVENAFEIWLMNRRPWRSDLRTYPFLDQLFDLELLAFQIAVEWFQGRTPSSRRSNTPRPPLLTDHHASDDEVRIEEIVERMTCQGILVSGPRGVLWSGPNISLANRPTRIEKGGQTAIRGRDRDSLLVCWDRTRMRSKCSEILELAAATNLPTLSIDLRLGILGVAGCRR